MTIVFVVVLDVNFTNSVDVQIDLTCFQYSTQFVRSYTYIHRISTHTAFSALIYENFGEHFRPVSAEVRN